MIETAVYDHPQLLEDFSTDLIISTRSTMWVPVSAIEEEGEDVLFNLIYTAADDDIFMDEIGDKACLYSLAKGLQGFLRITLPGARTRCQLSAAISRLDIPATGYHVFTDIREGEADIIAYRDGELLIAVTHPWRYPSEIAYHVLNIVELYGPENNVKMEFHDPKHLAEEGMRLLEEAGIECSPITVSGPDTDKLPLAMALLMGRRTEH